MQDDDFTNQLEQAFNENTEDKHTPDPVKEEVVEADTKPEPKEPEVKEETKEPVKEPTDENPELPKPSEVIEPEVKEETKEPAPLTEDSVRSIISELRNEERSSGRELEDTAKEVLEAYYPDGLSNTLVDESTGKEIKSPQDVVDLSNGSMDIDEATKWLMNEQYKLDKQVNEIKDSAREIAETTVKFKQDSTRALEKYESLFKWQPHLQKKVFDKLIQQTKYDEKKGVILSAPDVLDHYDFYLEPYQRAYEFNQQKPATNPETPPEPPKPSINDRLDVTGDGGGGADDDDPTDFAQQVAKELKRKD